MKDKLNNIEDSYIEDSCDYCYAKDCCDEIPDEQCLYKKLRNIMHHYPQSQE